jgi:tRNA (mo5U34)-methyltransferase
VLYHLKNPFRVLEKIHDLAHYCILTTRVFSQLPGSGVDVSKVSVAYFLRSRELNDDPTNYFVFTPMGLWTILERCGFRILAFERTSNRTDHLSDPVSMEREERAFVIMKADAPL